MKLTLGRQTDNGSIDQKSGSWRGGRNALVSEQFGAITNEPGFDLLIDNLPGTNIGDITLDSNLVAFFQVNGDNSEIYIGNLTTGTYQLITSNTEFGFDLAFPITGEYYRNSKGEIVIAFTDNHNSPRVMNTVTDYGDAIDKLTRIYLKYQVPILSDYNLLDTGGSLLTGAYYITTAYVSTDGAQSEFTPALGPFYVTDNIRSEIGDKYDGAKAGVVTSKSLSITLTNVDLDYKYLIIGLVSKIDGIVTAKQVKKIVISSDTVNTVILGSENEAVIAIEEITIGPDVYNKVKSMTQVNNQLIMADLSKEDAVAYQLMALDIKVNYGYTVMDINATDTTNPKLDTRRGFAHNEVYALYIHLIKEDGTVTKGFHLPGRPVAVYNNADFPEFNGMFENVSVTNAAGDHINRAVSIGGSGSRVFQFFNTANNPSATTNMQYWENTETYPNSPEFGALSGKPVRHHKFPSIAHIKSRNFSADSTFGMNKLTRLNIKISGVVLPAGYTGYFISSAKRTLVNASILAQDIMLYSGRRGRYVVTDQLYWTTAGNWSTHDDDPDNNFADNSHLRIHAFDLFIDRPAIAPNYVEAELTIRNRDIGVRYDFGAKTGGCILMSGGFYINRNTNPPKVMTLNGVSLNADDRQKDILMIDETRGNVAIEVTAPKKRFSKCSGFKYLPSNVEGGLGIYINLQAEECAVVALDTGDIFGFNGLTLKVYLSEDNRRFDQFSRGSGPTGGIGATGKPEEVTYLYNIKQYKTDMYANMFEQDLYIIHTNMIQPIDDTTISDVIGGDVLVGDMSFVTYAPSTPGDAQYNRGIRVGRRHIVEAVNFPSYRWQDPEKQSNFIPETTPFPFLMDIDKRQGQNQWAYNKDYTAVNDINSLTINDPIQNLQFNTGFPYRIIRSKVDQAEEQGINNWRTFPVNDYYEMPKQRGAITNVQGVGDNLVINQRYSLFRTRNKIKLATSAGEVIAGAGDIFELPPEEIISTKEGYAGCQHKSSCLLTKAGYFFVDAEQGKVFLLNEKLDEISLKGNQFFFYENLAGVNDNPYTDTGYTVGWDNKYNRILFGKTDDFTLSYSLDLEGGQWAFDHDYSPRSMFHTREGLFSFDNTGKVFRHNSATKRGIYYDDTIYPMSIIPVFNDPKEVAKYFYTIKWRSEIRNYLDGIQKTETLTQLFLYNSFQATDLIQLANYIQPSLSQYNLRNTAKIWHFNKFRDLVIDPSSPIVQNFLPHTGNVNVNKPFQLKRRFIDNYLLVNFIYDNQPIDGEQRNLYLYEVDADIKPIDR